MSTPKTISQDGAASQDTGPLQAKAPMAGSPDPTPAAYLSAAAEPAPPPAKRKARQYTTGRNIGFACKATQKTYDAIYEIADREQWKVAEVLENAVAALQRELAGKCPPSCLD